MGALSAAPGSGAVLQGSGFAPNGTAELTLQSAPVVLTRGAVGPDGRLDLGFAVPAWTPPGRHHLVLRVIGIDGQLTTVTRPLTVQPDRPPAEPALAGAGALLLLAGGGAGLTARRRTRKTARHPRASPG